MPEIFRGTSGRGGQCTCGTPDKIFQGAGRLLTGCPGSPGLLMQGDNWCVIEAHEVIRSQRLIGVRVADILQQVNEPGRIQYFL